MKFSTPIQNFNLGIQEKVQHWVCTLPGSGMTEIEGRGVSGRREFLLLWGFSNNWLLTFPSFISSTIRRFLSKILSSTSKVCGWKIPPGVFFETFIVYLSLKSLIVLKSPLYCTIHNRKIRDSFLVSIFLVKVLPSASSFQNVIVATKRMRSHGCVFFFHFHHFHVHIIRVFFFV